MRKKWSAPRLLSRRDFLRLTAAAAGTAAAGGMLSGCSEGGSENVRLMVWSPSQDQSMDSGEWLQTCCNRFAELHPEWNITLSTALRTRLPPAPPSARTPRPAPTCSCSQMTP